MRTSRSILAKLCILAAALFMTAKAHATDVNVTRMHFPVTLSDNHLYWVVGYLYTGYHANGTLQILLHGNSMNHRYWDVPEINGQSYSYARYMVDKGYAVLALDHLGTGESDRPDGDFLTLHEGAYGLHQITSFLGAIPFLKIVLVGHSMGAMNWIYSEGTFGRTADALVVTGLSVTPGASTIGPGALDPFLGTPYILFPPPLRQGLIYYPPTADPDVIAYDNANLNDVVPRGRLVETLEWLEDPSLMNASFVTEPVLVQLSDHDALFPIASIPNEAAYYTAAESITVEILSDIGHGPNLHLNHEVGWAQIDEWIDDAL